ncbi:hypothetical protein PGTUg99_010314 [Puccinia graminis f. sp. tritici]|uniref:Uncharacterized protein n=1 Tax=Puccinia graminis f. sp. tritici TaxID=56615 RepID=A0A5B0SAN2_PUCGR|nr:hypothetical protein PGTUg99_010314 [Puccinia graminis f. sp. tritici]
MVRTQVWIALEERNQHQWIGSVQDRRVWGIGQPIIPSSRTSITLTKLQGAIHCCLNVAGHHRHTGKIGRNNPTSVGRHGKHFMWETSLAPFLTSIKPSPSSL